MKVLLVVDMLNDFIAEDGVLSLKEAGYEIVPYIREKIEEARDNGVQVIYLNDSHDEDDLEFKRFPAHAVTGTKGAEVIDALKPKDGDMVITKQRYSGFFDTKLGDVLADLEPYEVDVTGCCTSICVAQTAADLANRDYKVVIDRNCVADFNPDAHKFYLDYQLPNIFGVEVR
jgi:nicotinamidase-related amidase